MLVAETSGAWAVGVTVVISAGARTPPMMVFGQESKWLNPFELDKYAEAVEKYVHTVAGLLGNKIGYEAASERVLVHLGSVVGQMLRDAPAQETADILIPRPRG
jgi:hypothetical protein